LIEFEAVGGRDSSSSSSIKASPLVKPMRARFGDMRVKGEAREAGDGAGEGEARSEFFESSYPISAKFLLGKRSKKIVEISVASYVSVNLPCTQVPRCPHSL